MSAMKSLRASRFGFILFCCLWLAGCMERREAVVVHEDGTVDFETRFEGDLEDFEGDNALLSPAGAWLVEERQDVNEDNHRRLVRTATLTVQAGQPLPDCYAQDRAAREHALQFPTEVTVEKRADGTYYHFRRVYRGRAWADLEGHYRKMFLESEDVKKLTDKDVAEWTASEKEAIVKAFVEFEEAKALALARQAAGGLPQAQRLAVHDVIHGAFAELPRQELAAMLESDSETATGEYKRLAKALEQTIQEKIPEALRRWGASEEDANSFLQELKQSRAKHAATLDLNDEHWSVIVTLPGTVVLHNGRGAQSSTVEWVFDAQALQDRDLALEATSVVR